MAATALSLACVDGRADYPSTVLSDGPAAYYRLNDSQARSAINVNSGSLGAAANATNDLPTGVVRSIPGAIVGDPNRASFFDFTTRTEIPFNREINRPADQPFTVEAWFLPSSDQSGSGMSPIANRWTQGGPRQGWVMFQRRPSADNTSGEGAIGWNFRMYSGVDTSTALEVTSGLPFVLGKWTHMVVVYEPVANAGVGTKLSMYIDGELANTAEWTNDSKPAYAPVTDDHPTDQAINGQPMLALGNYNNANGSLNPWFGAVDEFAFYPTKLSAAQIKAHYQNATNAGRTTAYPTLVKSDNPSVYLRLGELAPGAEGLVNVGDLRAAGNGTYTSEIRPGAPGALAGDSGDTTVIYHSRNGYASASIPFNEGFNPDSSVPFTFETWLKPTRDKQGGQCPINNRMVGPSGTSRTGWVIFQRNPNETYPASEGLGWNFRMYSGNGTSGQDVLTDTNYEVGRWQHLVVTWEPQVDNGDTGGNGNHQYQGILTAYVDGKQVARNENALYAANRAVPEEGQGKPVGVPADLGIGAYNLASGIGSNPFEGGIDEIAFYNNYVLKPEQIAAHYEAGKTRNPAKPYESLVYTAGFDANNSPDQTKERVTLPPLYLRFNEPASASAGNSGFVGSLAEGVMVNGANTAPGVTGPGFTGENAAVPITDRNFVSLNNPASLNFSGQISLEAWVKPDAAQGAVARILSHGPALQSDFASPGEAGITLAGSLLSPNEVSLRIENGSEYVLGSTDSAGFHGVRAPVGSDLGSGNWIHLVGVYDGTTWRLYRNGTQVASQADAVGAVAVPDGDWAIGSTGEGWADNFTGSIDEVAVYNKALTAAQAKAHYTAATVGDALKTALIKPTEALPVELPAGSVTFGGPGSMTVAGPGLVAWAAASNVDQPGDVQQFAYEEILGDFDISTKVTSVTSGPVTDPVDAWASGGLQARWALNALSPSFLVNVGNPKGVNEVRAIGRAAAAQNYTSFGRSYGGVDKTLPSQWIRLRRVGNWFAAYVGTDGSSWALVGQRWQEWPEKLLVGAYAFSASYNSADQTGGKNLATVGFSNYGKTVLNDNVAPSLVSAATMGKKVVGVKFSEPVASSGALVAANYSISQGTVTAVQGGIGGDSVYLTVNGLTADTFDVTVNNVTDAAGNQLPAGSKVTGRSSAWKSTDIGLIQSGNPDVRTAGDDPYRIGQAVAVASGSTETEIEIIGGGSNAWNPGDYVHYVSGVPLVGDFEVTVEVSRNDRPANTAAWANSGLMLREAEYLPGQQYTQDGTKVAMVANTTYIEGSAPNRAGIPLFREEPGAGYGNGNPGFAWTTPIGGIKGYYLDQRAIDAAGTPDPESSPLSSRWLRIKRAGNDFTFFVSYDGREWALLDGPKALPLSSQLIFGFSTMSDTGSGAPPNNAYGGNGFLGTDLEGQQNPSNDSVQRIRIGTSVAPRGDAPVKPAVSIQGSTVTFTGKFQEADSLTGTFKDVPGATSPYTIPVGSQVRFYRASN